ncbi:MAG: DNA polymerase III subunit alpha [Cyclobacteriaceae bacterium]|nr:DNA polymerase III subunit alpha [Cyclobacteriaceae bacterium HetDA_MAG_MS6]
MYLIFDTETTGLPHNKSAPVEELDNWPRLVQIAWQLHDEKGKLVSTGNHIVKPEGFTIPFNAEKIHGISTARANEVGEDRKEVLAKFTVDVKRAKALVGHNIEFDNKIIGAEYLRTDMENILVDFPNIDTSTETVEFCQLQGGIGGRLKQPRLIELYEKLFDQGFGDAHDAAYDVDATAKAFFECLRRQIIPPFESTEVEEIIYEAPDLDAANFAWIREKSDGKVGDTLVEVKDIKGAFSHLHVHSQYSVLQATPDVESIVAKAKELEMPAVAMTDLGNMFGAFKFVKAAISAGIKPIVGCEFFVAEERTKTKFTKDNPDKRFQQVLLAKNKNGYQNLAKLSSLGYMEGLYGLYPRIDKELIKTYCEDVIALSGGLAGEIPYLILNVGETQAEEALLWWKDVFGENFYLELNRHDLDEENHLNEVLISLAQKHEVKLIAANELFYLEQKDAKAHDVLICIKENEKQSTPVGRGRGFRPGLKNENYFFKSQDEMKESFRDCPQAIENIAALVDQIEQYELERDVLLPNFDIPEKFKDPEDEVDGGKRGENAYLKYLTYQGAEKRYDQVTEEIKERLDFELATIENTGYPGYFLIVQDFTSKAREMDVSVGPGRGSAAGSAVAYCIGITNVDPIAYDLLFERFLNPDRVSLPDIDIDFDNEGREKVIEYVVNKYGFSQVAQIITYGTMAPKSAIRDAGRVMELPLPDTDAIAKQVPERPGTKFPQVFKEVPELKELRKGSDLPAQVLNQAVVLEGSLRNTGIHACGVIITPDDMTKFIPMARSKDSELLVTQFDNSVVESAGMLKMDFLGLKTLSIIKTAVENIRKRHGIEIDIDAIPLDDPKTYELYQRGETNGTFQFESPGMQKHLRALKPDRFEDLIAMNALYRPGPMEYIPEFIARKQGRSPITYDVPDMEEFLAETYGITVYQEQVMLLSQKLAGFTKGEADVLRKAMGKKKRDVLDKMKPQFVEQAKEKGHPEEKLEKIWKDWEAFAAYAFNKSHSTCYSVVAYHTGYLKANYPAEYMASVLTHNQSNIDKVSFFMEECRNQTIPVLGPDVNESDQHFMVNKEGEIRFGLGAIKGTGESAVQAIIQERAENGHFDDIFDFATRVNLRAVNKKSFESLAKAGGFDCFPTYHRRQYVDPDDDGTSLIEKSIRYANKMQQEEASAQASLFGGGGEGGASMKPRAGHVEPYGEIEKLNIEREMVGLYITGHPLDQYKFEMDFLTRGKLGDLKELENLKGRELKIGGVVSSVQHRLSKKGTPFGQLTLEDFNDNHSFFLFSDTYLKFKSYLETGWFLYVTGSVQPRWNSEELEFKISNIEYLGDIREKMAKGLEVQMRLEDVNTVLVNELEQLVENHPGKGVLRLSVLGPYEDRMINLEMLSRKGSIDPSDALIKELDSMDEVRYKVLT